MSKPRIIKHKCKFCGRMFHNREYMVHLAKEHDDQRAKDILDELIDLK